jgi:Zn-dependent peptidase ImmA (M78 family)
VGDENAVTRKAAKAGDKTGGAQIGLWDDEAPPAMPEAPPVPRKPTTPASRARIPALCTPEMLSWARRGAGFPDTASASAKLKIAEERLVAWEAGTDRPSISQLRRISELYKRPLASFYLPKPPRDFTIRNQDFRRLAGVEARDYSPAMRLAMRTVAFRREAALELEPDEPPVSLVGSSASTEPAHVAAARARDALGVSLEQQRSWTGLYDPLNGWKTAIERLGVLVFHFTGVEVDEVRAFSASERRYPVIAVNGDDSVHGRVFSLLHEVGHLCLGEGGSCDLGDMSQSGRATADVESWCNAFAAVVLVPSAALLGEPSVSGAARGHEWTDGELRALSRRFRVSREVILRRLVTLERADIEFYRRHRVAWLELPRREKDDREARIARALLVIRDVGKPFARIVLDAYHADTISARDVSDYLGVRLKHLDAIEHRLASGNEVLTGRAG